MVGLGSEDVTVPSEPLRLSVTVTLPSTTVVVAPHVIGAVPVAVPALSSVALASVWSSHVIVAVFVWLELAGASEYVQL